MSQKLVEKATKEHLKALEGLKTVKTREELEQVQKLVKEKRDHLMKVSGALRTTSLARGEAERQNRWRPLPVDRTVKPLGIDGKRIVWICPECDARNVNYKKISSRGKRRKFTPGYVKFLEANGEPMTFDETKIQVGHGAPYCINCSQKLKRDVYMVRRTVKDILEDKLARAY